MRSFSFLNLALNDLKHAEVFILLMTVNPFQSVAYWQIVQDYSGLYGLCCLMT